jgi:glycosyltransferase involved in cell wall biosynthesis
MVKILNIMLAKGRGGLETMALTYHHALSEISPNVTNLGHDDGQLKDQGRFVKVKAQSDLDFWAMLQIKKALKSADLAFTHGNRAAGLSLMFAGKDNHKIIPVVHNFRYKSHLKKASKAIAVSKSVEAALRRDHPHLNVHLIENFLPITAHDLKTYNQIPPHIGVLGRLHKNKGFDRLITALAALKSEGHQFSLSIAGTGPEESSLRNLVRNSDLERETEFLGWLEDPAPYLRSLDLFVLPSRTEPFGIVLLEAMAAGSPVMASGIEGPLDLLSGKNIGIIIQSDNDSAFTEALTNDLRSYLINPSALLPMAKRAQETVLKHYDMKAGVRALKAIVNAKSPLA